MNKLSLEDWLKRFHEKHGDKYDYSKSTYVNSETPILIQCPIHGEFMQTPKHHWRGTGCPICSGVLKSNTEEFIAKAKAIHGDKYDYSKVKYKGNKIKVCIICHEKDKNGNEHGEFWITPNNHLSQKQGCLKCSIEKNVLNQTKGLKQFIAEARAIHGNKYDYSKVNYINNHTKICIICPIHGEFWQTPNSHISKRQQGCPKCAGNAKLTTAEFIAKAQKIHGRKYDYSKVEYKNAVTRVCIVCKECKKEFWQTPHEHLSGYGCSYCKKYKLEEAAMNLLRNNKINFIFQKEFDWLKYKSNLSLDFYLPDYNLAIECQGEQHFKSVDYFGGEKDFERRKIRDKLKYNLCKEHGVRILYYSDLTNYYTFLDEPLYHSVDEILNEIKSINA